MNAFSRRLRALLALALLLVACEAGTAHAQQQYALSNYDVTLTLQRSGAYTVEETIRFGFQRGTFTHARRAIPLDDIEAVRDVSVRGKNVTVTNVERNEEGGDAVIRWTFAERSRPATFTLRYTAEGALRAEDGGNVIDWQAVGTAWEVPVRSVDVRVQWPDFGLARDSIRLQPADEGTPQRASGGGGGAG